MTETMKDTMTPTQMPQSRRFGATRFPVAAVAAAAALLTLSAGGAAVSAIAVEQTPAQTPPAVQPRSSERTQPVAPPPDPDSALADAVKRGATMEEIAKLRDPIAKTPTEGIRALKAGNSRFYGGVARRPEMSANERRAQILSQTPFAVILGCSDSRVPTEIVYDQGLGSLFVVRVAGNVTEPGSVGSVEYAVKHLKSHVVVVMGHEGCGAVGAAMLPAEDQNREPANVRYLLGQIRPAVTGLAPLRDRKARMREAVIANVRLQVHRMKQNPVIAEAIKSGQIAVIGAFYEISSGAVDFLETEAELRLTPDELRLAGSAENRPAAAAGNAPHGDEHRH
jgi:carbonic anhydrase